MDLYAAMRAFIREPAAGLVTTVLRDYELERLPMHIVYPSRRLVSAKVRAASDFLADEFHTEPALIGRISDRADPASPARRLATREGAKRARFDR